MSSSSSLSLAIAFRAETKNYPVQCEHFYPRLSTLEMDAVQPRSVTEIAPESVLLSVNRSPIRYFFRAGAKACAKMMGFVNKVFKRDMHVKSKA